VHKATNPRFSIRSNFYLFNKSSFGQKFVEVAEKNRLRLNQDDFETSYIELDQQDFYTFMEDLTDYN